MKISGVIVVIVVVVLAGIGIFVGFQHFNQRSSSPLIVYSADAYVEETDSLLSGFHNSTGATFASAIGGGSFTDAREIGQGDPANAFISVALQSYNESYLGGRYSGWLVAFASDQLVLTYSSSNNSGEVGKIVSEFAAANANNNTTDYATAFDNLTSGKVNVGISDPGSDPAGLRGWISLEIAGELYADGNTSYYTDRLIANGGSVNGSSAADLVAPLTTGQIQFLFIYKSAAISKGLNYIVLPAQLNFGDPALSSFYSGFTYNTTGGVQHGSTIFLFISSLADNGELTNETLNFVLYVFDNRMSLSSFGLVPLKVPVLYNDTSPPVPILQLLNTGNVTSGGRF